MHTGFLRWRDPGCAYTRRREGLIVSTTYFNTNKRHASAADARYGNYNSIVGLKRSASYRFPVSTFSQMVHCKPAVHRFCKCAYVIYSSPGKGY
jgi:hypothetical protein